MGQIYMAPTANFVSKTLNGTITDTQTTITLNSTTNLQAPGAIVIDRVDSAGALTPNAREVIAYTGISGSDLTGCTRGFDNSTARTHADSAIVETTPVVGMWNNLATIVSSGLDSNGYLKALVSPVSLSLLFVNTRLDVSAASVTGIGIFPAWRSAGGFSGPTTAIGGLLVAPKVQSWKWISVITRTVASGSSVVFDVMNNGSSIFAGVTKPTIIGGGTYVSTASINTKALSPGNVLRADISALAAGYITDFTVQGGT